MVMVTANWERVMNAELSEWQLEQSGVACAKVQRLARSQKDLRGQGE